MVQVCPGNEFKLISQITDLAIKHDGVPGCTHSDIVLVTFHSRQSGISSLGFKTELLSNFRKDMRALYGTTRTVTGNLGNEKRMEYGNLNPGLNEALERLNNLKFGDIQKHEFPNSNISSEG